MGSGRSVRLLREMSDFELDSPEFKMQMNDNIEGFRPPVFMDAGYIRTFYCYGKDGTVFNIMIVKHTYHSRPINPPQCFIQPHPTSRKPTV